MLLMTIGSCAQEIALSTAHEVSFGEPYPVHNGTKYYFPVEDAILGIKVDGEVWTLQRIDRSTATEVSSTDYTDMPRNLHIEHMGYFADRFYVFYSVTSELDNQEMLFYRELDPQFSTFVGQPVLLVTTTGKPIGTIEGIRELGPQVDLFILLFSTDMQHLSVEYTLKDDASMGSSSFFAHVFNNDLVLEWSGKVQLPYHRDAIFWYLDRILLPDGRYCAVTTTFKDKNEYIIKKIRKPKYELIVGGNDGSGWQTVNMDLEGRWLEGLSLIRESSGRIRGAGYYSHRYGSSSIDGIYTCDIDPTFAFTNEQFHEIPSDLIKLYSDKYELVRIAKQEADGDDLCLKHMALQTVLPEMDGGLLMIGEQRWSEPVQEGNWAAGAILRADDMLLTRIDANGALVWMKRFPKHISRHSGAEGTYRYVRSAGAHHVFHFDQDYNINWSVDQKQYGKGTSVLMVDRIDDGTGDHARAAVLQLEGVKDRTLAQLHIQRAVAAGDELFMEAYGGKKKDVMVRIRSLDR